jgi:hypothetical protein
MGDGTIVLVHGTGVRLKSYTRSFAKAKAVAATQGIGADFLECAWGDVLGVDFEGRCLPDPPSENQLRADAQAFAEWSWLFDDPLFELHKLTIRDTSRVAQPLLPPGATPAWETLFESIRRYTPSSDLRLLLERGGLEDQFGAAWSDVIDDPTTRLAFEKSAHELPEAANALARAVVASLHIHATADGQPGPSRRLRDSLVQRLIVDWDQVVYAPGTFFANLFRRAATRMLRQHRSEFTDSAALPIGDVLLYQARGVEVRTYIRDKIARAKPPVTLVAHSLGGIACVDLLALANPPAVDRLVTVGSQSSLLYEIGALTSLKPPQPLPSSFPPWLNIFDRNDFLSYLAEPLFGRVTDVEVESGQPFPDSHSAYFGNDVVWRAIKDFSTP